MIFLLFVPVIGSRELDGKAAKDELALGMTSEIIPAGARATGGCCYGDQ